MNLCVAGFYFPAPFVAALQASKHSAIWICHREPPADFAMRYATAPNVGLEFGCYCEYLFHEWKGGPALFVHDDTDVTEAALDAIAAMTVDQAFLFASEAEAAANGNAHGRAIFCSEKFLTRLKVDGGFWYDERPSDGKPIPATTANEPAWHNTGIQVFLAYLQSLPQDEFSVNNIAIVSGLKTGYRGRI